MLKRSKKISTSSLRQNLDFLIIDFPIWCHWNEISSCLESTLATFLNSKNWSKIENPHLFCCFKSSYKRSWQWLEDKNACPPFHQIFALKIDWTWDQYFSSCVFIAVLMSTKQIHIMQTIRMHACILFYIADIFASWYSGRFGYYPFF